MVSYSVPPSFWKLFLSPRKRKRERAHKRAAGTQLLLQRALRHRHLAPAKFSSLCGSKSLLAPLLSTEIIQIKRGWSRSLNSSLWIPLLKVHKTSKPEIQREPSVRVTVFQSSYPTAIYFSKLLSFHLLLFSTQAPHHIMKRSYRLF